MSNQPNNEKALVGKNIFLSAINVNKIYDFVGYFDKKIIVASYDKQAYLPTLNVYYYDKNKKQAETEILGKIYQNYSQYEFILKEDQTKIYLSKVPQYHGNKLAPFKINNVNVDFFNKIKQESDVEQEKNQKEVFKEVYQSKTSFTPI